MQYVGTLSKFNTVSGWEDGPKKPEVNTVTSTNASDVQALLSNISVASLGDGESISLTVSAVNYN